MNGSGASSILMDSISPGTRSPTYWCPTKQAGSSSPQSFSTHTGWFNLIVTALGGMVEPVHNAGARARVAYPLMSLASKVGITAAAMTWGDRLTIGLTADAGTVPDLERVAAGVASSMDRLHQAASDPAASRTRWALCAALDWLVRAWEGRVAQQMPPTAHKRERGGQHSGSVEAEGS
jgi:hypothetical protein